MREFLEKRKPWGWAVLAFGATALVLCAVFACFELFPFGEKTLAWGDMTQQVIPLMLEFKDILAGKAGFLFNVQNAGGMSFWGVFFFFLSSPFTFLVAFIEKSEIYFLVNILVILKLALSSATASLFWKEEAPGLDLGAHLALCCSYGLCGYGLLYYQNIVWLDLMALFPILMLGFRRVACGRGAALFAAALTFAVILNYYLSYMVFLALILLSWTFLASCVPKKDRGETAGKIGASALMALLVSAPVWLPSLLQCLRSARTAQGLVDTIQGGGLLTELSTTLPVLLCTAAPVLGIKAPASPKRKALLTALLFLCLPLILEPVNKLWHTGSYQAFPARYGYIPLFLGLWCAAEGLETSPRQTGTLLPKPSRVWRAAIPPVLLAAAGGWILGTRLDQIDNYVHTLWFDGESFFFTALFAFLTICSLFLELRLFRKGGLTRRGLGAVLLTICLLQGGYHGAVLIGAAANVPERGKAVLATEGTLSDAGFYRVKQDFKFCDVNLLGAAGYPTLNHYTSLTDERFLHAVKKLGYSSYWMETSACCGTGISDVLLSNKYVLTGSLEWRETGAGNLGYLLLAGTFPEALGDGNRFELQNDLYRRVTGSPEDAFRRYSPKTGKGGYRYELTVTQGETLYFDAFRDNTNRLREPINDGFQVTVNGKEVCESYPNESCNGILSLGHFENQKVTVEIRAKKETGKLKSFGVYGLPDDKLGSFTESLKSADLHLQGSRITGAAEADGPGQSLFLSLTDVPGILVKVNGKSVEPKTVLDCFLEIPLEPGENWLELSFLPQGARSGAALSLAGLLLCLGALALRGTELAKKGRALWYRIAPPLLTLAFFAVLLAVYLLPLLLWCGRK